MCRSWAGSPMLKGQTSGTRLSAAAFLFVMTLGYAVYAADRTVLSSVLAPMSASLGLSNLEIGLLGSAQYIGVLAVVGAAGSFSDAYGRRRMVLFGLITFSLFTWLIAFATSFYAAFLFRLASGLGEGIFWPVAMASVADYFRDRKGLALGVFYVGFDAGSVAGLSIGGVAYYLTSAWQNAFLVAPVVGLAAVGGVYLLKSPFVCAGPLPRGISTGEAARALLRAPGMQLLMLFALLATWASVWQVVFLPFYFFKVMNFSVLSAALLSSLVSVSGGIGKVLLGGVSDRWSRNRVLVGLSAAVAASYGIFFFSTDFYISLASAMLMGFLSSAVFPVMQALVADRSGSYAGTGLGLTTTFQSVATVFSPAIAGYLLVLGVGKALALDAMVPAVLMTLAALFLKPAGKSAQASQPL